VGQLWVIEMRFGISSGFSSLQTARFRPEKKRVPDFARACDRAGYPNYRNSIKLGFNTQRGCIRRLKRVSLTSAPSSPDTMVRPSHRKPNKHSTKEARQVGGGDVIWLFIGSNGRPVRAGVSFGPGGSGRHRN
jgi:hypothetical protein